MKIIQSMMFLLVIVLFTACQGIPGRDGEDGLDGEYIVGAVFEVEGDFLPSNDWTLYFDIPTTINVLASDIVLTYILWEVDGSTDVWRLMPQTVVLPEGILQYNYDFTQSDVKIFLDGSLDLNDLLPAEALDQVFRIVVLPADFAINTSMNLTDYNLVVKAIGMDKMPVMRLDTEIKLEK